MFFVRTLEGVTKLAPLKKTRFLWCFQYFGSPEPQESGTIFFKQKKHAPRFVPSFQKKISVLKNDYEYLRGRGAQIIFSPCDNHISPKEASGNLKSITTFAALIMVYLPRKLYKFSLSRSRETRKKWRIPLQHFTAKTNRFFMSFFIIVIFTKN
jgi:hypothetical protein